MRNMLIVIFMVVAAASSPVLGEISIYLDGSPAPGSAAFVFGGPLPTLGVYSDDDTPWSGYILSSDFSLTNPQVNPINPLSFITPYNSPYGFQMSVPFSSSSSVAFTMDMDNQDDDFSTLITLWDDSSVFEVPVDTLDIWQGGWPGFSESETNADAGAAYSLAPGQTVAFDATDSTVSFLDEGEWDTHNISGDDVLAYWSINGTDIAFGLTPEISYETLVNGLNLDPGVYDLTLDLQYWGQDTAITTIEIVPEPATLLLLGFGGLALRRRRKE